MSHVLICGGILSFLQVLKQDFAKLDFRGQSTRAHILRCQQRWLHCPHPCGSTQHVKMMLQCFWWHRNGDKHQRVLSAFDANFRGKTVRLTHGSCTAPCTFFRTDSAIAIRNWEKATGSHSSLSRNARQFDKTSSRSLFRKHWCCLRVPTLKQSGTRR